MAEVVIPVSDPMKEYGDLAAVDDISFKVHMREILVLSTS